MSKTLVRKSFINVLGKLWMGGMATYQYKLDDYAIRNITNESGTITRADVEDWLTKNAGDFQSVKDFAASIELREDTIDIAWENEDNECEFSDIMYPSEED